MQQKDDKKILWHTLAFMAFSTVWGFGNVINGFSEYGGLKAIVSWILIFAIYFGFSRAKASSSWFSSVVLMLYPRYSRAAARASRELLIIST